MALPEWHPPARLTANDLRYPGSGELTEESLHAAVGSALTSWEKLEIFLAHLFDALVEAKSGAAFRAYGTIQGVEARRRAIEAAASSFFRFRPDPLLANIFALTKSYSNTATYRNNIAHGIIISMRTEVNEIPLEERYYLGPPVYSTRRWPLVWTPDSPIKISEIGYIYR